MKLKRVFAGLLILCCILTAGCTSKPKTFDYKSAYEDMGKDFIEQGYVIENLEKTTQKKFTPEDVCVCMGDSITGLANEPSDYPSVIAEETGMTVINCGFGGCRMSYHPYIEYNAFSMCTLADSVVSGEWSLQDRYVESVASNAPKRLKALKKVDWTQVDYLVIAYGSNDINVKVTLDNPENLYDTTTLKGALRYSIEKITTAYPHINIMILTPIYRYWTEDGTDSDTRDFDGYPFTYWVDGLIEVSDEYRLPCVDLYRNCGFNRINRTYYYNADDGVHPNKEGLERIGRIVSSALLYYY